MEVSIETEKSKKKQKRNFRLKSISEMKKKITRGSQRYTWAARRKNQWTWRENNGNYQGWGINRKKKRLKKTKQSLRELWDISPPKDQPTHCESPSRRERKRGRENRWRNKGPKLPNSMNTNIWEVQQTPSKRNSKRLTLLKDKDKERSKPSHMRDPQWDYEQTSHQKL